jgi:hypothetical protein
MRGRMIVASMMAAACVGLCGCLSTKTEEKPVLKPSFDNSHAMLIEKAIRGLEVVKTVKSYVDPKEKLAVVSIESPVTADFPVNYLIEDSLIANLLGADYTVLERDEDLLSRIRYEQGSRYQRVIPDSPSVLLLQGIQDNGMSFVGSSDNVNPKDAMDFFVKLSDFYKDLVAQVKVENADVLFSYRVLECGIMVEKEAPRKATDSEKAAKGDSTFDGLRVNFKREAMARLAVRVVDAKTGELRYAGILENRVNDVLVFDQAKDESELEFNAHVRQYQEYLQNYHYTFYDQQLPNQKGTKKTQEEIISTTTSAKSVPVPGAPKK